MLSTRSLMSTLGAALASVVLMACGDDGSPGVPGKDGAPGNPGKDGTTTPGGDLSVNGITPGRVFLARSATLTISGFGTKWTKEKPPVVDFGDTAIKVDKIDVASPTALIVSITAGPAAKAGSHTVKVGDQTYVGFQVESPIAVTVTGTITQGSVALVNVKNKDVENPFDTGAVNAAYLEGATASPRVTLNPGTPQVFSASFTVLTDVDAKVGKGDLVVASGAGASPVLSIAPGALEVKAATPKTLAVGTASTGTFGAAFASTLYEISTPADSLNNLVLTTTGTLPTGAAPRVALLKAPGHFADLVGSAATQTFLNDGAATKYYAVVVDLAGTSGYGFSIINAQTAPAQAIVEAEPNDSVATAQVSTAYPFLLKAATLSAAGDADWVKITAPGAKKLHVKTLPGDAQADTTLRVYAADGTTAVTALLDDDYHEDLLTPADLAAGTYYVKVGASSFQAPVAGKNKYLLLVTFE